MANIRQNLFLAFVYNLVSVPVAAGALYPLFGAAGLINPIWASVAMSLSSLSVLANSLRLRARGWIPGCDSSIKKQAIHYRAGGS